jgi:hypothetical protein
MRFFVKFEAFETIIGDEEVKRVREALARQIQKIQNSGKLIEGGMFGDKRGGFVIVDLDKSSDMLELLRGEVLDNCRVESHPVMSFQEIAEFFKKHPMSE